STLFDYVGGAGGSNPFKLVKRWQMHYHLQDKYAPLVTTYVSYDNNRIIAPHSPLLTHIEVEAIFDDPEAAHKCGCESCDFDDEEYPITGEIAQLIVQSILDIDFRRKEGTN